MHIPYVIDNQTHRLADVLLAILREHAGCSLDVATAYFSVSGYRELRAELDALGSFRLLLGAQPKDGSDIGLRPDPRTLHTALRGDLEREPFNEATMRLVEDLIAFLRRPSVSVRLYEHGFLHAKCYLFYADRAGQPALFERFHPLIGIVGSSNFTGPGLRTNKELNLAHKTLLDTTEINDRQARAAAEQLATAKASSEISETNRRVLKSEIGARAIIDLVAWYDTQWDTARDFKADLIDLLDGSKFGTRAYSPYQIYLKAIYEYLRDDLGELPPPSVRSAIDLAEFQEDAVKKARKILTRYDGVLIGDSVGMGKTRIGTRLLEEYAYHQRLQALVICPAALRDMWQQTLKAATIAAMIVSQEELGQQEGTLDLQDAGNADVILVDESHNFRNRTTQRYANLERIIAANRGGGRSGGRKKIILMTATPINNDVFDLYHQLVLITRNDRAYFAGAGIGDLFRYFVAARRRESVGEGSVALFNLLEEVVVRRTRPFIRTAYPQALINGEPVRWPERRLRTMQYDLEATYAGIYETIVAGIESLRLAHYNLESYKKGGVKRDQFEEGREQALVGIFKSRYLKRFESSIEAFRISIRRALAYLKTYEEYLLDGRLLDSRSFEKASRFLAREDEEDDATPTSLAEELDDRAESRAILEQLPSIDPSAYDLRQLHRALTKDIDSLTEIWRLIKDITPERDAKLAALKQLISNDLRGQKVLIFTYYKDTARYMYRELSGERGAAWRSAAGDPRIRRMDSGASPRERGGIIQAFSPTSNQRPAIIGSDKELDILVSTDVLSEGQNLQDCGIVINYDLHWNPTRMVQRAGRIDRLGSPHDVIWIYNMFPDSGLERLLGLVQSLSDKIQSIDRSGFLDASVLGEVVHPRNFNTMRRIRDEDGAVIAEQEQFIELASTEFLQQQLRTLLASGARDMLDTLPNGIHSGHHRAGSHGLFFYYTAPDPRTTGRQHFWRYYDATHDRILDNRFLIANLIACAHDTPRIIGELDVFAIQERIIAHILESVQGQAALEAAPTVVDPIQQTLITALTAQLQNPSLKRADLRSAIVALRIPTTTSHIRRLKELFQAYNADQDISALLTALRTLYGNETPAPSERSQPVVRLQREDLTLICFEHIVG